MKSGILVYSAQLFSHELVSSTISMPMTLRNCLNDIQSLMFTNKLKLNPDKTDVS